MASVGEKLRRARLDKGLDLAEVSARTKISVRFLEAIEGDDRQSLPAGFFYRNWVRQYASSLSLDVAAITAEVDQVISSDDPLPLPGQQHRLPSALRVAPMNVSGNGGGARMGTSVALLVIVILGCSGLYAWWHNTVQSTVAAGQVVEAPRSAPLNQREAPTPTPVSSPVEPSAVAPTPTPSEQAAAPKTEPPAAKPEPTPANPDDLKIEVSAIEQTWLSIAPDGKQVFSGVLHADEVKTVEAHETARIRVGNAAGLMVRLNGKPIGPIGTEGQVRTVIIDRTGVQILQPRPAAPSPAAFSNDNVPIAPALNQ